MTAKKEDGTNDNSSSTNGKADKKDTASKAAKTGDASTALPYMLLMLASGSAVVILKKQKRTVRSFRSRQKGRVKQTKVFHTPIFYRFYSNPSSTISLFPSAAVVASWSHLSF